MGADGRRRVGEACDASDQLDGFGHKRVPEARSMKMLSTHRPLPSVEMATPASLRVAVDFRLVNWLPWSV